MRNVLLLLALGCAGVACRPAASPELAADSLANPRVDTSSIQSVDEAAAWAYRHEVSADLTGDGQAERVVIASDVVLNAGGMPLWEDGHRWVVYVESPAGEATLLYSAFVPNGFAEAAVVGGDSDDRRRVLVQERSPGQIRSFDMEYNAPGEVRMSSDSRYEVAEWLPGSARMP